MRKALIDWIKLGLNAAILRAGFKRARERANVSGQRDISKNTKQSIKKRRNKFKGIAGDPKWKRL